MLRGNNLRILSEKTKSLHDSKIKKEAIKWAQKGSNLRPPDYESGALTN